MYCVVHNDATLLHQKNGDINKVYKKKRPIFTVINVWKQCSHVKQITFPVQKTNYSFKYDKKVMTLK